MRVRDDLQPAWVRGEPRLLERMIANLLDNGIRHNEAGGWLDVSTRTEGGTVRVVVANGGAQIDPADALTLGEPFRRLGRSVDGFGLGLSIVRSVAGVHGGSTEITAPEAGGLSVRVEVPSAPGAAESRAPEARSALKT